VNAITATRTINVVDERSLAKTTLAPVRNNALAANMIPSHQFVAAERTLVFRLVKNRFQLSIANNAKPSNNLKTNSPNPQRSVFKLIPRSAKNTLSLLTSTHLILSYLNNPTVRIIDLPRQTFKPIAAPTIPALAVTTSATVIATVNITKHMEVGRPNQHTTTPIFSMTMKD
jgi:hypothetical protein